MPTLDLVKAYETGDLRKDASLATSYTNARGQKIEQRYAIKFLSNPTGPNDAEDNFIELRYADVLLMLAEAINESNSGPNAEAYEQVNAIRKRAGLAALPTGLDYEGFKNRLLQERRVEFAFENHRWFDLLRFGKALEVMQAHASYNKAIVVTNTDLLLPIPQRKRDINPEGISQNPGY